MFAHGVRALALIAGLAHLGLVHASRRSSGRSSQQGRSPSSSPNGRNSTSSMGCSRSNSLERVGKAAKLDAPIPKRRGIDDKMSLSQPDETNMRQFWIDAHLTATTGKDATQRNIRRIVQHLRNDLIDLAKDTSGKRVVWHYKKRDVKGNWIKYGPVTWDMLTELFDRGHLSAEDQISHNTRTGIYRPRDYYMKNLIGSYEQTCYASTVVPDPELQIPDHLMRWLVDNPQFKRGAKKKMQAIATKLDVEFNSRKIGHGLRREFARFIGQVHGSYTTTQVLEAFYAVGCLNVKFENNQLIHIPMSGTPTPDDRVMHMMQDAHSR